MLEKAKKIADSAPEFAVVEKRVVRRAEPDFSNSNLPNPIKTTPASLENSQKILHPIMIGTGGIY